MVWKQFAEIIANSNKIVFIGYSLPDADVQIKYTIKRSCFDKVKKIVVIDVCRDVRDRYERMFGPVDFHEMGFADLLRPDKYREVIKHR